MIYEFKGVLNVFTDNRNTLKEPLSLENTLWASTILASKKTIGIVIYTGKETKRKPTFFIYSVIYLLLMHRYLYVRSIFIRI